MTSIVVDLTVLPRDDFVEFKESSFFAKHTSLPTVDEIRAEATRQSPGCISRPRPRPVWFHDLNLVVKWGPWITIAEG